MTWWLPAALFAVVFVVIAAAPFGPSEWIDRVLHFFGIGNLLATHAGLIVFGSAATLALASGYWITENSIMEGPLFFVDVTLLAIVGGLAIAWICSRLFPKRGLGLEE